MQRISKNKIRNSKVKYDIHMLMEFCNENNIILLDDYSEKFINRDTNLFKFKCKSPLGDPIVQIYISKQT
jgi:hypothetical protein